MPSGLHLIGMSAASAKASAWITGNATVTEHFESWSLDSPPGGVSKAAPSRLTNQRKSPARPVSSPEAVLLNFERLTALPSAEVRGRDLRLLTICLRPVTNRND